MIRMLVVGYVFAIRSERLICREVQVNLAYRWFCKHGIEDAIPDHSAFSRARNERFREGDVFRRVFERVVEACIAAISSVEFAARKKMDWSIRQHNR
jgi:transposase